MHPPPPVLRLPARPPRPHPLPRLLRSRLPPLRAQDRRQEGGPGQEALHGGASRRHFHCQRDQVWEGLLLLLLLLFVSVYFVAATVVAAPSLVLLRLIFMLLLSLLLTPWELQLMLLLLLLLLLASLLLQLLQVYLWPWLVLILLLFEMLLLMRPWLLLLLKPIFPANFCHFAVSNWYLFISSPGPLARWTTCSSLAWSSGRTSWHKRFTSKKQIRKQ